MIIRGQIHINRVKGCDWHTEGMCKLATDGGDFCNPSFGEDWWGGVASRVISSGVKDAKGGKSSKRVSSWNLAVNCARTKLVAG